MLVVTTLQITPRETRRNARSSLRGQTLGAITSIIMELNVVIGKLKDDNMIWQRNGYYYALSKVGNLIISCSDKSESIKAKVDAKKANYIFIQTFRARCIWMYKQFSSLSLSLSFRSWRRLTIRDTPRVWSVSKCKNFPIRHVAHCALTTPKAARDIDSYALFGHAGVHTRAYTHVTGICIHDYTSRVDRIAVRAAESESSCTYIFIYLSRTPFVLTCRPDHRE